jgi:hypothetical protein
MKDWFFRERDDTDSRRRPQRTSVEWNQEKRSWDGGDIGRQNDQDRVRLEKPSSNIIVASAVAGQGAMSSDKWYKRIMMIW